MSARAADRSRLAALFSPVAVEDVLSEYWLTRHMFCRGSANRFADLLSWPDLNRLLEHHWRETFRFRLARRGRDLDPSSYADLDGHTPRIRASDVTEHLRRGATLSFDAMDELHEPLTRLAEAFESFFQAGTKINIYAGWRALHGLDLHRDNQEIFILQLDGRKHWLLYGFSIDHIDRGDLFRTSAPPSGAVFDEVLEPGDLLYIPRGCYHVAVPMNEPTLHLTLSVKNPRALDLLRWIVDRLDTEALATVDLPILSDVAARRRFSGDLRRTLLDPLDDDLVSQYLDETGSNLKPRPSFNLPWSATTDLLPDGTRFSIRLNPHVRVLAGDSSGDPLELLFGGRRLRFPASMRSIVGILLDDSSMSMAGVIEALAGRVDADSARLLIGMLVKENLVAISA
ncbi:MAG: JmjC domain-containing protein [Vicinamibacterales bacterium]